MARVYNLLDGPLHRERDRPGWRFRTTRVGDELGAASIGGSVYELEDGERTYPYHLHHGIEEWLVVLAGSPSLRTPTGTRTLRTGDVVCFPAGAEGAHGISGPGRVLILSTGGPTSVAVYPDSDKVGTRVPDGGDVLDFRRASAVDYWDGEE